MTNPSQKNPKVTFTRGLQGSGKSTWARLVAESSPSTIVRVNRDDLRAMCGQYWFPKREPLISEIELSAIVSALAVGYEVIVDAMHLNDDSLRKKQSQVRDALLNKGFEKLAREVQFIERDFRYVPLEECIANDLKRERSVGERIIREYYKKYIAPPIEYPFVAGLPAAVIVDVDGTLAINTSGRSPYSWDRVHEDTVNTKVAEIVRSLERSNYMVIILSGRDSVCRDATAKWLMDNDIPHHYLWMRPHKDMRKDTVVKKELYETYIKDRFNIFAVIDDRLQVCRMWHELGLPLFKVGDPDLEF